MSTTAVATTPALCWMLEAFLRLNGPPPWLRRTACQPRMWCTASAARPRAPHQTCRPLASEHVALALTTVSEFRQRIARPDVRFIALHKPPGHAVPSYPG